MRSYVHRIGALFLLVGLVAALGYTVGSPAATEIDPLTRNQCVTHVEPDGTRVDLQLTWQEALEHFKFKGGQWVPRPGHERHPGTELEHRSPPQPMRLAVNHNGSPAESDPIPPPGRSLARMDRRAATPIRPMTP